jgi:sugar lactone lactonase YvrE
MNKLDEIQKAAEHLLWCIKHPNNVATATPDMSLQEHIKFNSEKIIKLSGELPCRI